MSHSRKGLGITETKAYFLGEGFGILKKQTQVQLGPGASLRYHSGQPVFGRGSKTTPAHVRQED